LQGNSYTNETAKITYTSSEEAKIAHDFIGAYKGLKRVQEFNNQSMMKDLHAENDRGNTEYKYLLSNTTQDRIIKLSTQMKFRLQEGSGEAFYIIGVHDNGEAVGITPEEMELSLRILHKMAACISAKLYIRSVRKGCKGEVVKIRVI
jgi:GTPase